MARRDPYRCKCGNPPDRFILSDGFCEDCYHAKLDEEGVPRIVRFRDCNFEICRKSLSMGWNRISLFGPTAEVLVRTCRLAERAAERPVLDLREKGEVDSMCQQCLDAVKKHWPGITDTERRDLLWGATAYPAGSADQIEEQLKEAAEKSGGNVGVALAIADEEIHRAHEEMKQDEQARHRGGKCKPEDYCPLCWEAEVQAMKAEFDSTPP